MDNQEQYSLGYKEFSSGSGHMMPTFDPHHKLFGPQAEIVMLGIPSTYKTQNPNPNPWQVDDSSLLCLLPGERNQQQQTSRELSLSLCKPEHSDSRDGFLSEAPNPHQQQLFAEDGRFVLPQQPNRLKRSKYLIPAQELLNEFCNLGAGGNTKRRPKKSSQWEEGGPSSPSWNQSLCSMDLVQLQKRRDKLLSMLEEVDRRYRKYCEQMRAVVSSFESLAEEGAATVYSTLASKAMSKHFRALRDGIVGQISATKRAMGEKDTVTLGSTRGETPRLKQLDQHLRQQKAFQQAGMSEGNPWRPQRGLPDPAVSVLRAWLFEHFLHPYPSGIDKHILARQTGLSRSQVSNWFINARVRLWKPMVEEMYLEELKDQDNQSSYATVGHSNNANHNPNPNPNSLGAENQKPNEGQLPTDSDSLASIINGARHSGRRDQPVPRGESFEAVDIDFSSYNSTFSNNSVSLTLGLQQHGGGGMTLSFSPASQQSLLFLREQMDDGQPVQYSILDGEAQKPPYRNLVGAQLLHDLAG